MMDPVIIRIALSGDFLAQRMHDGAGNEASVEALPEILRYCQEQGYEFRVIDETTPQFHHHINN